MVFDPDLLDDSLPFCHNSGHCTNIESKIINPPYLYSLPQMFAF